MSSGVSSFPLVVEYCFKRHFLELFSQNLENAGLCFDEITASVLSFINFYNQQK